MFCDVCGLTFDDTHNCPGASYLAEGDTRPPEGFAPVYYFQQALKIVCWDDAAIRRAARDPNSLGYGIVFWIMGTAISYSAGVVMAALNGASVNPIVALFGLGVVLVIAATTDTIRYGMCHTIAKYVFGGTGKFVTILRPLSLGSILLWVSWVPFVGLPVAGIGIIAIVMLTFEEIEGIERMQAFGISVVVNLAFLYLSIAFLSQLHR